MDYRVLPRRGLAVLGVFLASVSVVTGVAQTPASATVTSVRGSAFGYTLNVGLFGGPQNRRGYGQVVCPMTNPPPGCVNSTQAPSSASPSVSLPSTGSGSPITAQDNDGAAGVLGPATIFGGEWPDDVQTAPPSGPMSVSTEGTTGSGGSVTSSADITLNPTPIVVTCASGFTPPCTAPGGYGPFPVSGDELHVSCSASESGVTGSTSLVNSQLATTTDSNGDPKDIENVPDDPPVNYTRSGIITNVGDDFTVVYNEHIVNPDGSLTVNGAHMYLFGPTAVGEVIKGSVTCGTTPSAIAPNDTTAPSCGLPVVVLDAPEGNPVVPQQKSIGVFDSGGLATITNIQAVNSTYRIGNDPNSAYSYLKFVSGQTGPLAVFATRTDESMPMTFSFDAVDMAGNVRHCKIPADDTPVDFSGDERSDLSVVRPATQTWYSHPSSGGGSDLTLTYGASGDIYVPADYDGDGKVDVAIFRPSTGLWAVHYSTTGADVLMTYGVSTDIPVPADYDGDRRADIAVYRPSVGTWYIRLSSNDTDRIVTYGGLSGDLPIPADYDGDLKADLAIFRQPAGTWFVHPSSGAADLSVAWGLNTDVPVVGDYDGDGSTDIAIFRPSVGLWAIRKSSGGTGLVTYGISSDLPVPGDYDGDARTDIAVFRPGVGTWYERRSLTGADTIAVYGISTDVPLALPSPVREAYY